MESQAAAGSETPVMSPPAWRSRWAWTRFLLPAALGLAADLWTKAWAFPDGILRDPATHKLIDSLTGEPLPQGRFVHTREIDQTFQLIPNFLTIETTANEGAVFGSFQGKVMFFLLFSLVALLLIGWVFATSRRRQRWLHLALGLITAGAIGNLYDRALFGAVRDFMKFNVNWYPYIFNVADVLLCVGVPLLMICWVFTKDTARKASPH